MGQSHTNGDEPYDIVVKRSGISLSAFSDQDDVGGRALSMWSVLASEGRIPRFAHLGRSRHRTNGDSCATWPRTARPGLYRFSDYGAAVGKTANAAVHFQRQVPEVRIAAVHGMGGFLSTAHHAGPTVGGERLSLGLPSHGSLRSL